MQITGGETAADCSQFQYTDDVKSGSGKAASIRSILRIRIWGKGWAILSHFRIFGLRLIGTTDKSPSASRATQPSRAKGLADPDGIRDRHVTL